MPYPDMPTRVPSNAHKVRRVQSIRKLLLLSMTWNQPNRIVPAYKYLKRFNHCIVRLNRNDAIVRLKFAKFQPV